jgi:hypothetical protein
LSTQKAKQLATKLLAASWCFIIGGVPISKEEKKAILDMIK